MLSKKINNFHIKSILKYSLLFIIFTSPATISFLFTYFRLPFDLYPYWCKEGFEYFSELFYIPLKLLWYCILSYGILIAIFKLHGTEKLYKLNYESFKLIYEPIVITDTLKYNKKNKELIFNFINTGKYFARLISLHIDYKEPNNVNRMSTYYRNLSLSVMPHKPQAFKIKFKHDKPQIIESWFENDKSTNLIVTIEYFGSNNIYYQLNEIWRTNRETNLFDLIDFNVTEK
ncbi:MAG: hypothetical protein GF353_00565 [Candidatus Lokiarchaeota archaeon]|nr:hypothetical protein [Candidatus Lokiarchaeota archaeon]